MEIARCGRRVGEGGELLVCGDDVGQDHAGDGEGGEEGARDGEAMKDARATVVADQEDADGSAEGGMQGFGDGVAVGQLVIAGRGGRGVAIAREL